MAVDDSLADVSKADNGNASADDGHALGRGEDLEEPEVGGRGFGKLMQRQKRELKDLKEAYRREVAKASSKVAKRELEKEYDTKQRNLMEQHALELQHLKVVPTSSASELSKTKSTDGIDGVGGGLSPQVASAPTDTSRGTDFPADSTSKGYAATPPLMPFYRERELSRKEQKKKKRREEKEEQNRSCQALAEAAPRLDEIETQEIEAILAKEDLRIHSVAGDGHCLYRAIEFQLRQLEQFGEEVEVHSYGTLRQIAAACLREHKEQFLPYLDLSSTSSDESDDRDEFDQYCWRVAETAEWGGEVEIQALTQALRRRIVVYSTNPTPYYYGQEAVAMDGREERPRRPIKLAFHRHLLKSGAHYNSVATLVRRTEEDM